VKKLSAVLVVMGLMLAGSAWAQASYDQVNSGTRATPVKSDTLARNASKTSLVYDVGNCSRFWLTFTKVWPTPADTAGKAVYDTTRTVIAVRAVEVLNAYAGTDTAQTAAGMTEYAAGSDSTEVPWFPRDSAGIGAITVRVIQPSWTVAGADEMVGVILPNKSSLNWTAAATLFTDRPSYRFDFIDWRGVPMRAQWVKFRWRVLSGPATVRLRVVLGKECY
jgi:hypothetical protein